ncbi:MAG: hypothetical protein IPJ34_15670 [Myxococcales bacterium]|nr:hypothetical protein [Myxococcales bacterium]
MARVSATEMVGVTLTSDEAHRLLAALAEGKLGAPDAPENLVLHRKLQVMLQIANATERRKGTPG